MTPMKTLELEQTAVASFAASGGSAPLVKLPDAPDREFCGVGGVLPFYDAAGVTIYKGNALPVLMQLPSESVDWRTTPRNMGSIMRLVIVQILGGMGKPTLALPRPVGCACKVRQRRIAAERKAEAQCPGRKRRNETMTTETPETLTKPEAGALLPPATG